MGIKSPCKHCTERVANTEKNCHSYCEKYLKYAEECEKIREAKRNEKLGYPERKVTQKWSY